MSKSSDDVWRGKLRSLDDIIGVFQYFPKVRKKTIKISICFLEY